MSSYFDLGKTFCRVSDAMPEVYTVCRSLLRETSKACSIPWFKCLFVCGFFFVCVCHVVVRVCFRIEKSVEKVVIQKGMVLFLGGQKTKVIFFGTPKCFLSGYKKIGIDFFTEVKGVSSIVKLLLTFWKVKKRQRVGFNSRRPQKAAVQKQQKADVP